MTPFASILIGIDFSPASRVALGHAARIAGWSAADLHAAHVLDKAVVRDLAKNWRGTPADLDRLVRREVEVRWTEFARERAAVPLEIEIDQRAPGLFRAAEARHADLLVIGLGGNDLIGSSRMADACIRRAPADVLVVNGTTSGPFQRIVAAVDFSETSRRVVMRAALMAARDEAQLALVHLCERPWHGGIFAAPTVDSGTYNWSAESNLLRRQLTEFARPWLDGMPAEAVEFHIEADTAHRSGIASFARNFDADLVVLGARPATSIRDRLLGTAAVKILRETRCCALAVKPPPARAAAAA